MERPHADRYLTLDAMRGLAAVAVAVFHSRRDLAPVAYLAVDFFFALSGFVLAKAYAAQLAAGASPWRFIESRMVRLYPLFLVGLSLGLMWHLQATLRLVPDSVSMPVLVGSALFNVAMMPSWITVALYPTNTVFWSVAAELLVNLAFATVLVRLRRLPVLAVAAASGAAVIALARPPHFADGGWMWPTIGLGLARTLFSFVVGYLLAAFGQSGQRRASAGALLLLCVFSAVLFGEPGTAYRRGYDLTAILIGFPLLLFFAARVEPPSARWRGLAAWLGDVSYPLYAIHQPVGAMIHSMCDHSHIPSAAALPISLIVMTGSATAFGRYWDKPVRRWLTTWLALRRTARPQVL